MLRQTRSSRRRGTRILTAASAYAVERLEPRRLLATLNVSGTGSHDVIEVDVRLDGFIHVTINGDHNVHSALQYSDILVKASSGDDTIHVPRNFGRQVTVDGDLGDDTLWVGGGNFGDFIDVPVWFDDVDGLDALVIDDRNGGGGESYSMYNSGAGTFHGFRENDFFLDDEIRWHNSVNGASLLGSGGNDRYSILSMPGNVTILAGAGDDVLTYGADHIARLYAPATIDGGAGDDLIVLDDTNPQSDWSSYAVTPTHAFGQQSTSFEQIRIQSRPSGGTTATISGMAGAGVVNVFDAVRLELGRRLFPSSPPIPIDVDDAGLNVNATDVGRLTVYDQHAGGNLAPWLYDSPRFRKGTSAVNFVGGVAVDLNGGTSNDVFNVAYVPPDTSLIVRGGEGDDACQTANGALMLFDNDLDHVYQGDFTFEGGDGVDLIDLNDSNDQTGDFDNIYTLAAGGDGAAFAYELKKNNLRILRHRQAERVNLVGDADGNEIRVANRPTGAQYGVTLNGGGGADIILNDSPSNPGTLNGCSVIGGAGPDTLIIDGASAGNTAYLIDDFFYTIGSASNPPSAYDASLESISLGAGNGNNLVRVTGKPAGTTLAVDMLAGDDTLEAGGGDLDSFGFAADNTTLTGGAGNDLILFDDAFDGPGEDENYLFDNLFFEKGGARLTHFGFDRMEVRGGSANSFYRVSATLMPIAITGGAGNESVIFPLANLDVLINKPLTANLGDGSDAVIASDGADTGGDAYALYADRLEKNPGANAAVIHYGQVETFNLIGTAGNNVVNVNSTAPGTSYTIDANAGNDAVHLGGGDVSANLLGTVSLQGNTGTDTLYADNAADATAASRVLTRTDFTDGRTHGYGGFESVVVNAGPGGGSLAINANAVPVTFNGGAGGDEVAVGGGNIGANNLANITVNGNAGDDHVLFDDQLDATGTDIYEFIAGDVLRTPLHGGLFRSFDANGVERRTLRAAGGANSINVSGTASELRIHANGGNDNVTVSAAAAPVIVDTGTEAPTAQVPGDALTVNADVNVDADDRVARLTVNAQGVVHLDGRATLDVTDDLVLTGAIDLGAGAFVVRGAAADYRDVETWLRDGYAGGAWNGTAPTGAINSSAAASSAAGDAVGLALASDLFTAFPATFAGAADVGAGDVLLRHTLYGDANLDARVNLADFNRLASSFGQTGRRWVHGDSDFTSEVNLSDFNRLAGNFGNSASAAVLDRAAAPPRRLIDGLLKELLA